MINTSTSLARALPIVARALGRKLNVNVRIGGQRACTDGNTIYVPELPLQDPDVATLAYGYLGHEAAHVRYSDFTITPGDFVSPLHKRLAAVLEDVRIEKIIGDSYPGVKQNLSRLCGKVIEKGGFSIPKTDDHPAEKLERYVMFRLRSSYIGQTAIDTIADETEAIYRATTPKGLAVKIDAIISGISSTKNERDIVAMAARIVESIKEESEKQSENSSTQPQPEEQQDASGASGPKQDSGASSQQQNAAQESKPPPTTTCDQSSQLNDLLNATKDNLGQEYGKIVEGLLANSAGQSVREQGRTLGAGLGYAEEVVEAVANASDLIVRTRASTNALTTRMRDLLAASQSERTSTGYSGPRIVPRKLHRVGVGDGRIFARRQHTTALNTAVAILVDRSSSMDGRFMEVARESALAVSLALDEMSDVQQTVAVFPGVNSPVQKLAPFGEPIRRHAGRFGNVVASGGTPMAEALWWAFDELMARDEERRIVFVITDGELSTNKEHPSSYHVVRNLVDLATRSGIEMMGIGIHAKDVAQIFPKHCIIEDINELPKSMFHMLEDVLRH